MSSFFKVELDTTAPDLVVRAKQDPGDPTLVFLEVEFGDAEELQIWGDINILDAVNANYGENASAPWFTPESPLTVRLASIEEPVLHISARDDVWNAATVVERFRTGVEPAPIPQPPSSGLPGREPVPTPEPESRQLSRSTSLHLRARHSLRSGHQNSHGARIHVQRRTSRISPPRERVHRQARVGLRRRGETHGAHGSLGKVQVGATHTIQRRGDDDFAALLAIDLLM